MVPTLLVLNAGSSSLKFQVFEQHEGKEPRRVFRGLFDGLGTAPNFMVRDGSGTRLDEGRWESGERFGHEQALLHLATWLSEHRGGYRLAAVGHRVVHGGPVFRKPVLVDDAVLRTLEQFIPLAPLHQGHNLEPIRVVSRRFPQLPQIACFDTSFHQTQPEIARLIALPREIRDKGVQRYGFHGLSYAYLASVFPNYGAPLASGKVVVAHLGNGASLCAMANGASVATTMGFSALDGLPMGTRSGSIDAGVIFYMLSEMRLDVAEVEQVLYSRSGLLGVSGVSNDMRKLRALAPTDPDARLAIDLFVYRINREIGSLVAALGGLDALVFTAGIGENDPATRREVLHAARWAGFKIDEEANMRGTGLITQEGSPQAWVIPTDEELIMARDMQRMLAGEQLAEATG
ncbi:acetate/propionate family kinase [Labrys okinawensis]|uniref:acetate/propionate family kinase n=1 Tax=Labrys okinawensis TaxID=346911 RepID=UPI0039BC8EA1